LRVLRRIFGPRREEATAGWRKLHREELHNLYTSNIIRVIKSLSRWAGHVAHMRGEMHTIFGSENLKGRNRSKDVGIDNIRMGLTETDWKGADWIHLAQDGD
jgi:hypothetical protein